MKLGVVVTLTMVEGPARDRRGLCERLIKAMYRGNQLATNTVVVVRLEVAENAFYPTEMLQFHSIRPYNIIRDMPTQRDT